MLIIELNIRLTYTFELSYYQNWEKNSSCSHILLILKSENWNYIQSQFKLYP